MKSRTEQTPATPDPSDPVQSSKREHPPTPLRQRIHLALQRGWRHLHFRFPRLVPSPDQAEREYLLSRDASDNLASRVPPEEQLRRIALWGVEVYGPAHANLLRQALERFGWHGFNPWNPNLLTSWQHRDDSQKWIWLGLIERPGENRFISTHHAPLPDIADHAHGWICYLSPSVVVLGMCFVLKEAATGTCQSAIDSDRKTVYVPFNGGLHLFPVGHAKERSIESDRLWARATVVDWFSAHIPGLFSLGQYDSELPTVELITTVEQDLLNARHQTVAPDWKCLAIPDVEEVWTLADLEGLRLCWTGLDSRLQRHGIAHLQTSLVSSEHLAGRGDPCDRVFAVLVNERIQGVLTHFAVNAALSEIIRWLRLSSSSLSTENTTRRGTVESLNKIRLFFDRSVGIPEFTAELSATSESIGFYQSSWHDFRAQSWLDDEPTQVSAALHQRTKALASRATSLEKETRVHFEQIAAIIATRENVRIQVRMERVAYVALFISLASLMVSLCSLGSDRISVCRLAGYLNQQLSRFAAPR